MMSLILTQTHTHKIGPGHYSTSTPYPLHHGYQFDNETALLVPAALTRGAKAKGQQQKQKKTPMVEFCATAQWHLPRTFIRHRISDLHYILCGAHASYSAEAFKFQKYEQS